MRINHFKTIQNNPYKKQVPHMNEIHVKSAYKKDEIQISDEAKKLLSSSKFEQDRMDKVQEIKQQVDSGTFKVNVAKTAASIISYYYKA
ncbi:flagellar biosynthesis anti-sigma factor FlgM [Fictibacillus sp. b24]|uniref:flagellar biosynthesis anti-sigma factor FlgM n=1 Tax=Fictibacillus sp. b24 TaxID=3055863 RepID=UPI0025A12D65|nr:flagellar biosynthesis anti-sigma factor FlgM [Fictibacillus sp. b24]MDM5315075.1 flagellar biosynthesis anti-sigma factor FlgM [Fictibacillus sp. b24]